jgi:hypothetical protein
VNLSATWSAATTKKRKAVGFSYLVPQKHKKSFVFIRLGATFAQGSRRMGKRLAKQSTSRWSLAKLEENGILHLSKLNKRQNAVFF